MAVYQVAIIFEAFEDTDATYVAEKIAEAVNAEDTGLIAEAKIAFTKFVKEAPEVADI